jgi:hypothetical protein
MDATKLEFDEDGSAAAIEVAGASHDVIVVTVDQASATAADVFFRRRRSDTTKVSGSSSSVRARKAGMNPGWR